MPGNETQNHEDSKTIPNIPWLKKHTRLERILFVVTVASLLTVVGLTAAVAYFGYHYNKVSKEMNVCQTPGCVKAAAEILSYLDESVDPCDDFYQFTCGKWLKTHEIPEEKSSVSIYSETSDYLDLQLKSLLESKLDDTEPSFIKMTKYVYKTCMDVKGIEEEGSQYFKNVLKGLGGWPVVEGRKWDENKFDWLEVLILLRNIGYSHNYLFSLSVVVDSKHNSRHIIDLDETSLGIGDRTYLINGLNDTLTAAYYKRMVKSATLLGADKTTAEIELLEALQLEMTLANYSLPSEERRNASKLYNIYTIKELQRMAPQVPWLRFISGILNKELYENETINVAVPLFIKQFADLITRLDKRVIANYILWRVVQESSSYLSKDWRDIVLEYSAVLSGTSREKPRSLICLHEVSGNLGIALSSYYVRHHFKDETKSQVSELVAYVYKEFLRILDKIDWMDEKTKTHAKAKANNMLFHIGYPEELLNNTAVMEVYKSLTISKDSYFENSLRIYKWATDDAFSMLRKPNDRKEWKKLSDVTVVNAFYMPLDNGISLPAGYLQNPFFNKDRPNYLNFASVGSTIGHEITHGFDDEGRQFDKDGNNLNWWANITDEKFRKKAQCIINQYSSYTAENGMKLNGVNTQGENIADNGGVKESYWAYQSWVKDNGPEKLLPGLKYSQNQLFWISGAAYEFCGKFRPEMLKDMIISGAHSPDEFRVIGPMSNLVEFARDFNCPPNSPMNKKHKCQVW